MLKFLCEYTNVVKQQICKGKKNALSKKYSTGFTC